MTNAEIRDKFDIIYECEARAQILGNIKLTEEIEIFINRLWDKGYSDITED